jgi:hypothetical protein
MFRSDRAGAVKSADEDESTEEDIEEVESNELDNDEDEDDALVRLFRYFKLSFISPLITILFIYNKKREITS